MKKAFALISVLLLSALLFLLSSSFVVISISDLKIGASQEKGLQAYYWSEAGINKAIWKISHDSQWMSLFASGSLNKELSENNFSVSIQSIAPGKADISSIGTEANAQRIVKTKIIKSIGNNFPEDISLFSDNDTELVLSYMRLYDGDAFSNDDLGIYVFSNLKIAGKARAGDNIEVDWLSSLDAEEILENQQGITMPALDFDKFKKQADYIYTKQEFKNLLKNHPNLVLDGIIYVTGEINLKNGTNLTVNGLLISDDHIKIGSSYSNLVNLTIHNTPGEPSGLIAKKKIWIGNWVKKINIDGLIYSNEKLSITHFRPGLEFNLRGGIITSSLEIWSNYHEYYITHDAQIIKDVLAGGSDSPIIDIEHWEEEY